METLNYVVLGVTLVFAIGLPILVAILKRNQHQH